MAATTTTHAPEAIKKYLKGIGEWNKFKSYLAEDRPLKEIFSEFWDREDIMRMLRLPPLNHELCRKGDQDSNKFRAEGNRLYKKKNFEKALLAYNYAVMTAPHPEAYYTPQELKQEPTRFETLAMAYASRSALLFEVARYEECLKDIERATIYGYPADKISKLIERKKKCLDKKVNVENAETASTDRYAYLFYRGPNCPEIIKDKNKERYHTVTKAIKVDYSPSKGRHLIASENIEPGEILMVERALCSIPKLDVTVRSYCCVCLRKAPIVLPCTKCSLVAFCSDECLQSQSNNHETECPFLPILITSQADEELGLVYRTLLKYTMEDINSEIQSVPRIVSDENNLKSLLQPSQDYSILRNLEGNIRQRSNECYIETIVNAIRVVQLLQKTQKFWQRKDGAKPTLHEDEETLKTLGAEVMVLLLNFQCNIHCLKEVRVDTSKNILTAGCYESGYGVFNTFSLMNHSCAPNALHSNWGDTKFMYAINFIPKGEEVYDSYGERYVSHDLEKRQSSLKEHYYFDCSCKACKNDWPKFDKLPKELDLKCPKCDALLDCSTSICDICKRVFVISTKEDKKKKKKKSQETTDLYDSDEMFASIEVAWKTYRTAYEEINRYKTSMGIVRKIAKYISLLDKYTCTPHALLVEAQEALLRAFDLMGSFTFLFPKNKEIENL